MARRETKKRLLTAKRSIISTAMTKFLEHLENVSDETYGHILKELFVKIPPKAGRVLVPTHRKEITEKFAPKDLEIVSDEGISGGFIVRTQDAEIDNSFPNIVLSEFCNELEAFFVQKLALI